MYKQITYNKRKTAILIAIFIFILLLLGWLIGQLYDYGWQGLILALGISAAISLFSYYQGDRVALWSTGAKPITKDDNPYLYRIIENLCLTAGLSLPKIYLIQDPSPNAFATGRDPKHASIAVTTGLLGMLANEELEGVLAHELSHIKNYDIRLMTIVVVLVGTIALISNWTLRWSFLGGGRRSNNEKGGNLGAILAIVGVILIILSPLIAQLIQLAISRKREFLADASGALLTRYPEGLASALEKIASHKRPMLRANTATAHLFIANPYGAAKKMATFFSTHPPIEKRIKALRAMAENK
jgi:heat shock protein HtpX